MALHESALMAQRTVSQADSAPYLRDGKAPSDLPLEEIVSHPEVQARPTQEPPTFGRDTGGAESATPHAVKSRLFRKLFFAAASLAALLGAAYYGWQYWTVGRFEVSTSDAYVQADNTTIAPKVSGYIAAVLVADNEPVKAGQKFSPVSTIGTLRSRSSRPRPMSPPRARLLPISRRH